MDCITTSSDERRLCDKHFIFWNANWLILTLQDGARYEGSQLAPRLRTVRVVGEDKLIRSENLIMKPARKDVAHASCGQNKLACLQ